MSAQDATPREQSQVPPSDAHGATPRRLIVHQLDPTRIVLAEYPDTTVARTSVGMFSDDDNARHATLIVRAVNAHAPLVAALQACIGVLRHEQRKDCSGIGFAARFTALDQAHAALRLAGEEVPHA